MRETSPEVRRLAWELHGIKSRQDRLERGLSTPQLTRSSVDNGSVLEKDENGTVVSVWGRQHDGTHGTAILNGPQPPAPTDPIVLPVPGGAVIRYGGGFVRDGMLDPELREPLDLAGIDAYATRIADAPLTPQNRLQQVSQSGPGEITVTLPEGEWYIRLRARSIPGIPSAASAPVLVDVPEPVTVEQVRHEIEVNGQRIVWGEEPEEPVEGMAWFDGPLGGPYVVRRRVGDGWEDVPLDDAVFSATSVVGQMVAGNLTVMMQIQALGGLRAVAPEEGGDETILDNRGLRLVVPGAPAEGGGDEADQEIARWGRRQVIRDPETGEILWAANEDGSTAGTHASYESLSVGGQDYNDALASMGGRIVAYDFANGVRGTYDTQTGYRRFSFDATGGRAYMIFVNVEMASDGSGTLFSYLHKTEAPPGQDPPVAQVTSPEFERAVFYSQGSSGYRAHWSALFVPTSDESTRWLLAGRAGGNVPFEFRRARIAVVDIGEHAELEPTGEYALGGAAPAPNDPPPPPEAPPTVQERDIPRHADSWAVWSNYGRTAPAYHDGYARVGIGGSSVYRTYMGFPDDLRQTLNAVPASRIQRIRVFVRAARGNPGQPLWLYWTSEPNPGVVHDAEPYASGGFNAGTFSPGQGREIVISPRSNSGAWPSWRNAFSAGGGGAGIRFGRPDTGVSVIDFYAPPHYLRPYIVVDYIG